MVVVLVAVVVAVIEKGLIQTYRAGQKFTSLAMNEYRTQ